MDISAYIKPELLVLIPVLYIIGYFIKRSNIRDERIPLILTALGIFLATLWIVSQAPLLDSQAWGLALFAGITQGVLATGVAVLGNQILIQAVKANKTTSEQLLSELTIPESYGSQIKTASLLEEEKKEPPAEV